jgi:hypothetical protein
MKLGRGFSPFDLATIRITLLCQYNSGKRCVTPRFENKEAQKPKGLQAVISYSEYELLNPYKLVMLCRWVHPLPNFHHHFM